MVVSASLERAGGGDSVPVILRIDTTTGKAWKLEYMPVKDAPYLCWQELPEPSDYGKLIEQMKASQKK